jgi:hypothetical protein
MIDAVPFENKGNTMHYDDEGAVDDDHKNLVGNEGIEVEDESDEPSAGSEIEDEASVGETNSNNESSYVENLVGNEVIEEEDESNEPFAGSEIEDEVSMSETNSNDNVITKDANFIFNSRQGEVSIREGIDTINLVGLNGVSSTVLNLESNECTLNAETFMIPQDASNVNPAIQSQDLSLYDYNFVKADKHRSSTHQGSIDSNNEADESAKPLTVQPRFDHNEYIGFSGDTAEFDALVTVGSNGLPEGTIAEPHQDSFTDSGIANSVLRFDHNKYIGLSGDTAEYDALVTLGSNGLPEAGGEYSGGIRSRRRKNPTRFDANDYLGDSGDTLNYDAVISLNSDGFPDTTGVLTQSHASKYRIRSKSSARLHHVADSNGLETSEEAHMNDGGINGVSTAKDSNNVRRRKRKTFKSSPDQYSSEYEELPEVFARLYQGGAGKHLRKNKSPQGANDKDATNAAYAHLAHSAGIPSHRIRKDGKRQNKSELLSNKLSSDAPYRPGRGNKHASYSHYAAQKSNSPSERWKQKVSHVSRGSFQSSPGTTAISIFDKLYRPSRLSGPRRTLTKSYMPEKSRWQRLYGYDSSKSRQNTPIRKHRMSATVFMKLYELSLQRQIEGKNRRLLIECELQRREAERSGVLVIDHTSECNRLALHRQRTNQSRTLLQKELARPKKISLEQATEFYKRLMHQKYRTEKKMKEVRKKRELRENEWQRSQHKEKISLARLHDLYNNKTIASDLRSTERSTYS